MKTLTYGGASVTLNRLKIGTSVRIVHQPSKDRGYVKAHHKMREAGNGLTGIIAAEHDSHGLCYEVKLPSGNVITYDREELEVVA